MKTIGLIGGMTPESTKVYYELLIQGARQSDGDPLRNPEILIYSLNPPKSHSSSRTTIFRFRFSIPPKPTLLRFSRPLPE